METDNPPELSTFSVVAHDPQEGAFGVAVSTARPCVGSLVPFVSLRGAIATQARVNPELGRQGLRLLELGLSVEEALGVLLNRDAQRDMRQVHGVDARGAWAFTGEACVPWAGHRSEAHFSVAGNMLTGPEVLAAMAEAMRRSPDLPLEERLLRALEAGQAAGGDRRGKESAALLVASPQPRLSHNLRVDDSPDPVAELRRLHGVVEEQLRTLLAQYGPEGLRGFNRIKW